MKAAVLNKLNEYLSVEELYLPDRLDYGQVLVRVFVSGICGAQIREICGAKGSDPYLPHLLGHEGSGMVVDVGPGVKTVKVGDHVVMHWRKGVGIDASFPRYNRSNVTIGTVGGGAITTFNEMAVVSENRLTAINKAVPFDVAALMGCAVTTALGLINNEAQLKIGQSIAVAGCGGVGLNIIQGATMVSAHPIIAIDLIEAKLVMASSFGATATINTGEMNLTEGVAEVVGKRGVDVFVDCTGDVGTINKGFSVTAPGGRMILVGQPDCHQDLVISAVHKHYCGKVMMDSQGGMTDPTLDIPRYIDLYLKGKLKFDGLITGRFALDDVNEAIEYARSGLAGRVVLELRRDSDA